MTRYTIPQYLCIHSHVRLDFSSPVSWQKACIAKWLRPKRRCKCDTVDSVKRNFGLILYNEVWNWFHYCFPFCFFMIIPTRSLGGKAPRGHKAANKMEICVPQAAPLNPFSEESLSRVKDNLKLRDASLAKAAAVRQKRAFGAGHNRLN